MITKYEKTMYHNYMLIENIYEHKDNFQEEMLANNKVQGLLPMEIRYFNDEKKYYYNITGLNNLLTVFERKSPDKKQLEFLFKQIIYHIKNIRDYLLEENDILLLPEQIFFHINKREVLLCCCPGYNEDIMEQLARLLEFFMNKIEYSDKEAVVLIYTLYMKSRDSNCKIDELLNIIEEEQEETADEEDNIINHEETKYDKIKGEIPIIHPPGIEEKIENEIEVMYYPIKSYILAIASLLASLILFYAVYRSGLLHQPLGIKIDKIKAGFMLLFFFCFNISIIYKLFNKKNKCSKIQLEAEYNIPKDVIINSRNKADFQPINLKTSLFSQREISYAKADMGYKDEQKAYSTIDSSSAKADMRYKDEHYTVDGIPETMALSLSDETVILKDYRNRCSVKLIPEDENNYQVIDLTEFPFFIGKLKYSTNSCIVRPTISKIHAKIIEEDSNYIICDLNSTNGTFVNGIRLPVNGYKKISDNDRISFADVTYIFSCPQESDMIQLI